MSILRTTYLSSTVGTEQPKVLKSFLSSQAGMRNYPGELLFVVCSPSLSDSSPFEVRYPRHSSMDSIPCIVGLWVTILSSEMGLRLDNVRAIPREQCNPWLVCGRKLRGEFLVGNFSISRQNIRFACRSCSVELAATCTISLRTEHSVECPGKGGRWSDHYTPHSSCDLEES